MDENQYSLFSKLVKHGRQIKLSYGQRKILLREDHSSALFTLSLGLAVAVRKIFRDKTKISLSREPMIEKKPLTYFMRRIRIDPMEKFNAPAVVSAVHFYKNRSDLDNQKSVGLLLCYVEISFLSELLQIMDYPEIDDDDEDQVEDACGALCNIIAGYFKNEIIALGYSPLEMSSFESYINTVTDGIDCPLKISNRYEVSYEIAGKKRLVTEMAMLPLAKIAG